MEMRRERLPGWGCAGTRELAACRAAFCPPGPAPLQAFGPGMAVPTRLPSPRPGGLPELPQTRDGRSQHPGEKASL